MNTLFFENMSDEKKSVLKEKYNEVYKQVEKAFQSYKSVHDKAKCIEIEWAWDDYNITINANSKLIKDDSYKITVNLFNVAYLEEIFDNHNICENIKQQSISAIMSFTLWHEISHILYGHCTIPKELNNQISNSEKRKIETMCDLNAAYCFLCELFVYLSQKKANNNEIINRYAMLLSVLFVYFKELEEIQNIGDVTYMLRKPVCSGDRDHLFSTLRFDLVCCAIEHSIECNYKLSKAEIDSIYDISVKWIIEFGYKDPLFIKPFYRRNNKYMTEAVPNGTEWLDNYVAKKYI